MSCAIYYWDLSIFITFFFFLFLAKVFFNKQKGTAIKLQRVSFLVNVCCAVLITLSFETIYGTWHSRGKDDLTFYTIAIKLLEGKDGFYFTGHYFDWAAVKYKLYVLVFAIWYKILNFIGINGNLFFHLNIINSFVGSFIAPFIYKIGLKLFGNSSVTPKKAAIVCLFFPPLVYYSAVIIRDIWVLSFFLMIIYLVISDKNVIKKIVLIVLLLMVIYYIRSSNAFFMLLFIMLYVILNIKSRVVTFIINKVIPILALVVFILLFIILQLPTAETAPPKTDVFNFFKYTINYYRELAASQSVENSIGLKLRLSNNPIILILYYIYVYLGPIPPKFIKDFNIINVFLGIGNFIWYVMSPLYFLHSFQLRKTSCNVFVKSYFWFLIIVLIIVGTATGTQRHILFVYPIILLFSVDYILNHKKQFYVYLKAFLFLSLIGVLIYSFVKTIL